MTDSLPSLHAQLRAATAPAHEALEDALDLLREPLERQRFVQVLVGFHGFYTCWEPAVAPQLPTSVVPMSRLELIESDLRRLGLDNGSIASIEPCADAAALGDDAPTARGSLYVMEGSTLGGRVISASLSKASWCPPGGLHYFDPYGHDTANRWRRTLAHLAAERGDSQRVINGALRTFAILHAWLVAPLDTTRAQATETPWTTSTP